ncbi:hypothetical protein [Candidatus Uabimicrobium amorphum]|uniref:Uncharacterized protein n=1 Tax=Uabimicrobium amorphum TaxID=2596890 RepID=A0A5S9IUS6_UABAM|nr:hypothetical protein [Candidatus Uabimicrobium amorphum]BBM86985.1 hypothetical protein UABAM_05387 [Candidatus Uabimicrobium amorphum]
MSLYIAKIMGPILAVVAVSLLLHRERYVAIVDGFLENPVVWYVVSILTMMFGLIMVNAHNHWILGWEVILTFFGWMGLVKGVLLLIIPQQIINLGTILKSSKTLPVAGVVYLALGIFISLKGYIVI